MAKLTLKVISDLQIGQEKPFIFDTFRELNNARSTLYNWGMENPDRGYKSRMERVDDKFILFVTIYDKTRT